MAVRQAEENDEDEQDVETLAVSGVGCVVGWGGMGWGKLGVGWG